MAFSEVFTALQQNTLEGQENPLSLIESASFNEVQDYGLEQIAHTVLRHDETPVPAPAGRSRPPPPLHPVCGWVLV